MGAFATRQIILLPFPYSDLSAQKMRPALILAHTGRGDWLLCQITSNPYADPFAVELQQDAFVAGGLQRISYARPEAIAIATSIKQSAAQRQNILRAAFSGQLVPQDPDDEPASVLLERIRAERAKRDTLKKPRGRKTKEAG